MEKIKRPDAPVWLKENWKQWGEEWESRYAINNNSSFYWHTYKKRKTWDLLIELLSELTRNHCSFCDGYPMGKRIPYTIEHFKPKTRFPLQAYQWENLFLCCGLCQEKGDDYDERLLKPDEDYYNFDRYFDIDWANGELIPNRGASEEDRERAKITIRLYRLNSNGKPEDRLEELKKFDQMSNPEIDRFSYRFFIERGQI